MIEFKFNPITGELNLDGLPLKIDTEEGFCKCDLYHELVKRKAVNKNMSNHYLVDSVMFFDKEFQVTIRPVCYGFHFMLHLVDKNSQYYKSLNDWNARTNVHMLNESVKSLSDWLKESLNWTRLIPRKQTSLGGTLSGGGFQSHMRQSHLIMGYI